jgi:predicted porin
MKTPTLGLIAAAILYASHAVAQGAAAAPAAPAAAPAAPGGAPGEPPKDKPDLEAYGTLLPFLEYVWTAGATPLGSTSTAPLLAPSGAFTGIDHPGRFRMSSGTSHFGFRGDLPIADDYLKLIWQIESPVPIDGDGPAFWGSRNSHVGFTGMWGTLLYGNWDTPMKVVTATSVNPIKGGYVADMIPIIGTAGSSTFALNPDPILLAAWQLPVNRAGFFRHETNTVQYWTPTVAGFSGRVMFAANEHRIIGTPADPPLRPTEAAVSINPYLISTYIGWDNEWLRLRAAYEYHRDYFGLGSLGGGLGEGPESAHSRDAGVLGLGMVKINAKSDYMTRIVVTGDYLKYHTNDTTELGIGQVNNLSRAAVYGLIQQHYKKISLWVAGGHATEGTCSLKGNDPVSGAPRTCATKGMSADYGTVGVLLSFTKDSGIYAIGYGLWNDIAARYSPFPLIDREHATNASLPNTGQISYGSDTKSFGLGFVHVFNVGIFGKDMTKPPPEKPKAAPPAPTAPAETAAPTEKPEEKPADESPPGDAAAEPEETEEKPPAAKP